jgi:hypothetical protein
MSRVTQSMRAQIARGPDVVQLRLLPGDSPAQIRPPDWSLDEHTRRIGRRGVAQARETLRRSARSHR